MRHIIRLTEIASQFRRHAKDGKKIVRAARLADALRFDITGGAGQIRVVAAEQSKIGETALGDAPIEIIRQANRTGIEKICALANEHESVRLRIRQRPQEHSVDDAENRRVGADAERERDDRNTRKSGRLAELAERKLEVFHIIRHVAPELDRYGLRATRVKNMQREKQS